MNLSRGSFEYQNKNYWIVYTDKKLKRVRYYLILSGIKHAFWRTMVWTDV